MADRKVESYGVSDQPKILERAAFDAVKPPKRNKYALGCAILASMTSILLGYGTYETIFLYIMYVSVHVVSHLGVQVQHEHS